MLTNSTANIKKYIEPVTHVPSVHNIRIGTKSLAWWPYRFTTDHDADDLLRYMESLVSRGKHVTLIAHFTHPRELETEIVKQAISRVQSTGAVIRCQGPMIKNINDSAEVWATMWQKQISLGMQPYYLFIDADHAPQECFQIPLAKVLDIFQSALRKVSPLARVVRGPVFMNNYDRVLLDGVAELEGKKYFALKCLQSPDPSMEGQLRFAPFDEKLTQINHLKELFHPNTP